MKLRPIHKNVIIKAIKPDEKIASGIVIPDSIIKKLKTYRGEIIAVGDEVESVKLGDKVIFKKYGPEEIEIDKEEYLVCEEDEIIAIIEP